GALRLVALAPHAAHALALLGLKARVDAQDLDGRFLVDDEVVDTDHDPTLLLELFLVAERGVRDLLLEEADLDRRDDAANLVDALEVGLSLPFHLVGQRLHEVAAAERIDGVRYAGLVGEELLRAQGDARRTVRRQR